MDEGATEASRVLRRHGTQLITKTNFIPLYPLWNFFRVVRKRKDIEDAYKGLIFLSNSISVGDPIVNLEKSKQINKCLGVGVKKESNEEQVKRAP